MTKSPFVVVNFALYVSGAFAVAFVGSSSSGCSVEASGPDATGAAVCIAETAGDAGVAAGAAVVAACVVAAGGSSGVALPQPAAAAAAVIPSAPSALNAIKERAGDDPTKAGTTRTKEKG